MALFKNIIVANLLLAIVYFIAGQFTLTLSLPPSGATPLWAPAGIAVAAVLIWGYRLLPGVFFGDFFVAVDLIGVSDSISIALCILIGTQALFHAWLGRWLLERFKVWPSALIEDRNILKFFVLAGVISSFFPAALTVVADLILGVLDSSTWLDSLVIWWIGGALGVVVFTPIVLILFSTPRQIWNPRITTVALPMIVLFIVLVITLHSVSKNERKQVEDRFNSYVEIAHAVAEGQLKNYSLLLRNLTAFYKHSDHVTDEGFSQFLNSSLEEESDIFAAFWAELVLDEDREVYERHIGQPIMVLDDITNQFVTASKKAEYLVIKQSRIPLEHYDAAWQPSGFIGVDFCSKNNQDKCQLLLETGKAQAFLPYLVDVDSTALQRTIHVSPVFDDNGRVRGIVALVYHYDELFEKLLSSDIKKWLDFTVSSDTSELVMFDTREKETAPAVFSGLELISEQRIMFGPQQWRFNYLPSPQFIQTYSSWSFFWMITGALVLLGLIGSWLMAMSGRVHQVRQQVKLQTDEITAASELLRKNEFKYRSLVESIKNEYIIFSRGKDYRLNYVSPSVTSILGHSQEEFIEQYETYVPDIFLNKKLSGSNTSYEIEVLDSEKRVHIFAINSTALLNENDEIIGIEGIAHDITERKKSQQALEKLSLAVKHSPNAVMITDLKGNIEYVNPQFTFITGYEAAEVIGIKPSILKSGLTAESVYTELWDTLLSGHEWRGEMHNRDKSGDLYWAREHICPLFDENNDVSHFVATQEDVTEAKKLSEETSYQASHDLLTGLVNRREFEFRLDRVIKSVKDDQSEHALCFMDLDQFKIINDTCGHVAGDELLRQVGDLLLSNVRQRDTLARLGGDEFALLMEHCGLEQAYETCQKIIELLADFRFHWEEHVFTIGISIGLAQINKHIQDSHEVLAYVDGACYSAKDAGRNRVEVHTDDSERLKQRQGEIQWSSEINGALDNNRFELYCQPIVPLDNRDGGISYEVLLRLRMQDGTIVPPGAFLPAAERYNSITQIDRWVIEHSLIWISRNEQYLHHVKSFSINLSGQSLGDEAMLGFIIREFQRGDVPAEKIKFEITETAAIANLRDATVFMRSLSEFGCQFALDDFGSGLSSFAYLKNLKVDVLKIDGMFVKDMLDDPLDFEMVKSINDIGHVMGLETIAEFVESEDIADKLREIGVDYAQGYALGRPVPIDETLLKK